MCVCVCVVMGRDYAAQVFVGPFPLLHVSCHYKVKTKHKGLHNSTNIQHLRRDINDPRFFFCTNVQYLRRPPHTSTHIHADIVLNRRYMYVVVI